MSLVYLYCYSSNPFNLNLLSPFKNKSSSMGNANCCEITLCECSGIKFDINNTLSCSGLRRTCSARQSFQSLQKEWEILITAKNQFEERDHRRRSQSVDEWLSRVESIQSEFNQLQTDYDSQQSANNCFSTNLYTFGRKVARVQKDVESLSNSKPVEVAQQLAILPPQEIPVEPTIGMDSMLDEVWRYMEDDEFGIIGIYGMGGVGKSTLMKKLHNKLRENSSQSSNVIVFWIVISSTPNLSKVQDDIGSVLGFKDNEWKEKSQDEKAKVILGTLKRKKYVLFIDDVWERIDLLNLGVPLPDQTNKSKIVLTTRSREVCGVMGVDNRRTIKVKCLNEEAAWDLFRENAGEKTINDDPEIQAIAKLVAKECAGLPLALTVIGRAMACNTTLDAWNIASNQFKEYASEFKGMKDNILPLLKYSYDSISNASMKPCFLYCSLYPEDAFISRADIVDKWICEGFLDTRLDLHEARKLGNHYIYTLINASLLEEATHNPTMFKMHDIIRDMANWIGCECGEKKNKFYVRAGDGLTETPNVAEFEGSERISLMRNEIVELAGKPNCSNLLTLFLQHVGVKCRIENGFFRGMDKLRVLDLSNNWNRNIGEMSEIPEAVFDLVTLQYLNLGYTKTAPIHICKLINLKWLCYIFYDGTGPTRIKYTPPKVKVVLSSLKKLQVLRVHDYSNLPETFVADMEGLEHLQDLQFGIYNDVHLQGLSSSKKLVNIITSLSVHQITWTNLDLLFSQNMVKLDTLAIRVCFKLENVMSMEIKGSSTIKYTNYVQSLRTLTIVMCPKLKDIAMLTFAPNLEEVTIQNCEGMKELCGEWKWGISTPFPKLKTLRLYSLPELERIYANTLPLFPCLKYMTINECPKLRKFPFNSSIGDSGNGVNIQGKEDWWNGLEWEDEATRIAFSHSFTPI